MLAYARDKTVFLREVGGVWRSFWESLVERRLFDQVKDERTGIVRLVGKSTGGALVWALSGVMS